MPVVCRKLVRDRIPEIIQSEGRRPVTRVLDEARYRQALLAKLIEEAREANHATPTTFLASWPTCWKYSAPCRRDLAGPTTGRGRTAQRF
jgi:hypothetical protein